MLTRRDVTAGAAALAVALLLLTAAVTAVAAHGGRPAASPAGAATEAAGSGFAPLWSQPVNGAARLVVGGGATAVWAAQDTASGAALLSRHFDGAGKASEDDPVVLAAGITGLTAWLAAPGRGSDVLLAWKAGGAVVVAGRTASGASVFAPVTACSDIAVAKARGAGATATPLALEADGRGGAYLLLAVTPSSAAGDSLLTHVSSDGQLAVPDPGVAVAEGTAALIEADGEGHLYALLTGPGRSGVALQRFGPELEPDWARPVGPYNPLVGPPSPTAQIPVDLGAGAGAWMAWREKDSVLVQRFGTSGDRLWLRPAAVTAAPGARAAGDGAGGVYVTSAAGTTLSVAHVAAGGPAAGPPAQSSLDTGRPGLRLDAVCSDASGDLDAAFSRSGGGDAGVAEMTCLGVWTSSAVAPPASRLPVLADDGSGGAYALGEGDGARLWRFGERGGALTLRPRAAALTFGDTLAVSGYLTLDGAPLRDAEVRLTQTVGTSPAAARTDAGGHYAARFKPDASATWTATAQTPDGTQVVSVPVAVAVATDISLTLSTRRAGAVYRTFFSGEVHPAHPGSTIVIQRQQAGSWRPLTSAKLDATSSYRASWKLPLRTATYLFRTVLPAHDDHAEGVSPPVRLKVVVKTR